VTRGVSVVVAGVAIMAAVVTTNAQRRRGNDNTAQGAPVATNTILHSPDLYYGKLVTVSAGIEQVLSKTAFVLDQRKAVNTNEVRSIGAPLLVIAPTLSGTLDPKHYVMVRGQVIKFDRDAIARMAAGYTLDLSPELDTKFQGRPALLATAVIDSTYTDLAKKPGEVKP
jgi:hypothetical protein